MSWYDRVSARPVTPMTPQQIQGLQFQNPFQQFQAMMQAMSNPARFVRENLPGLPPDIADNPSQILAYLQQTYGITNEQIQQLVQQYPYPGRF